MSDEFEVSGKTTQIMGMIVFCIVSFVIGWYSGAISKNPLSGEELMYNLELAMDNPPIPNVSLLKGMDIETELTLGKMKQVYSQYPSQVEMAVKSSLIDFCYTHPPKGFKTLSQKRIEGKYDLS